MQYLKVLTFNPFQENTILIYDDSKACIIIDAGCYSEEEEYFLSNFIDKQGLTPKRLLNTHCHIDHVFGNQFVNKKYGLLPECHEDDLKLIDALPMVAQMYGIQGLKMPPKPEKVLSTSDIIKEGEIELEIRHVPGHAPGHIVFINHQEKYVVNGDCLFQGSIGRTDLPFANHEQLIESIYSQLFTLPDDYTVYTGHGGSTTIGEEKRTNPFLKA